MSSTAAAGNASGMDYWESTTILVMNASNGSDGQVHEVQLEDMGGGSKTFELVTNGILLTSLAILGLIGNFMSISVLSRPQMRSSINCCLMGLSSFDVVVLAVAVLMCGLKALPFPSFAIYEREYFPRLIPVVYPLGLIAQTGSVWVTVTVTAERYIAVCHPLRARYLCTYGRARIYIIVITLFSVCYNLPRFWETQQVFWENPDTNETEIFVMPSDLRKNETYVRVYLIWLYLFVMYFFPFLTLAVLNTVIWRKVREANRERQRLSRLQKKEISLAIMLFVVVIVFFICNMLALVVSILEAADIMFDSLTQTSNLMVTINSSVNFVIYCIFGQKFRRILLRMFFPCLLPRAEEQLEESVYPAPTITMHTTETKSLCSNGTNNGNNSSVYKQSTLSSTMKMANYSPIAGSGKRLP